MSSTSKAQLLTEIHTLLKKRYKPKPERNGKLSVLEAVIYTVCHEAASREQANQALSRFKDEFFDWNEVRVSSLEEVENALAGLSDSESRAHRIRRFLRQLFEKTYGFNLDALTKKPLKESLKTLSEYEVFSSDYVEAGVTLLALGGHAIPVDSPSRRALERLEIVEADAEIPAVRALLERAVPKNRGAEFTDLLEDLTLDTCVEGEPDCPHCELRKMCPTGISRKDQAQSAAKAAAAKAKASAKEPTKEPTKEPKKNPTPATESNKDKTPPKSGGRSGRAK